jgi:hypothetical protein
LEGTYDILLDGTISEQPGSHLSGRQKVTREKLVAAVAHKRSTGLKPKEAVDAYLREAAFTTLNRFVALKMLEARKLVQECVSKGEDSSGFREFTALAPGLVAVEEKGYRLYIETLFDEIGQEVKVLFDRHDIASLLWPNRQTLLELLGILNAPELANVWVEDETIGWVYQYFNGDDDVRAAKYDEHGKPKVPQNSRELAVRNQFFTPRYVVQFLIDNTLGRTWYEMMGGETKLSYLDYLVHRPNEVFLAEGETAPESKMGDSEPSQEELLQQTVYVLFRAKKDPRDLRILDPACGSGHFLLYAFELLISIYEEAWSDAGAAVFTETGTSLRDDYVTIDALRRAMPELILCHNLHGVDIDPRAAQIAALALWMRAQRAYNQFEVNRAERPPITKTNIVVAEPMPGDAELVEEFAASLKPAVLGDLFKKMIEEMKLAGELGSLLKIEESIAKAVKDAAESQRQGSLFAGKIESQDFWDTADEKIIAALGDFAESAAGSTGIRRQLFVGDAVQGVAFIDLMRKWFDVVVMNPPFGSVPSKVYTYLKKEYPTAFIDVLAAFVERGRHLSPKGLVGAITSRSCLYTKTLVQWREKHMINGLKILADLGSGVLDAALVNTCCFVCKPPSETVDALFLDVRNENNRAVAILSRLALLNKHSALADNTYIKSTRRFSRLPQSRILYWLPREFGALIGCAQKFEPEAGTARAGLTTYDDFRFLRLAWEVKPKTIGVGKEWINLCKGGYFETFYADVHLVLNWDRTGREVGAFNRALYNTEAQSRRGSSFYLKPAITYPRRSVRGFSARQLPTDCFFADKGPAILPNGEVKSDYLLGLFNSSLFRALIHIQSAGGCFETGVLKELPWRQASTEDASRLANLARDALAQKMFVYSHLDNDAFFAGWEITETGIENIFTVFENMVEHANATIRSTTENITRLVESIFALPELDYSEFDINEFDHDLQHAEGLTSNIAIADQLVSICTGIIFGRWTSGEMFQMRRGVYVIPDRPPWQYLQEANTKDVELYSDFCVDDIGQSHDIQSLISDVLERAWQGESNAIMQKLAEVLGFRELREYFRKRFFGLHIKRYSKSRRKAPIYWQLATPFASYSVWCYYHSLTSDTFFRIANDYVTPKVDHEERKLNALRQEAGPDPSSKQRKAIDAQETFVADLRAFKSEVTRIAPLWNPNLNDGVIINFAPLWRLVPQHKPWQKECKKVWDKLVKGDYDWAHLAIHLWPERVVPKCKDDRSLAIAHGLEDEFWIEDDKGKWQKRQVGGARMEVLVTERSSTAVKAALKDLIEAPAPAGQTRRKRRTRS